MARAVGTVELSPCREPAKGTWRGVPGDLNVDLIWRVTTTGGIRPDASVELRIEAAGTRQSRAQTPYAGLHWLAHRSQLNQRAERPHRGALCGPAGAARRWPQAPCRRRWPCSSRDARSWCTAARGRGPCLAASRPSRWPSWRRRYATGAIRIPPCPPVRLRLPPIPPCSPTSRTPRQGGTPRVSNWPPRRR